MAQVTPSHPLDGLLVWAMNHGAYMHPLVELFQDPIKGWGFKIVPANMWPKPEEITNQEDRDSIVAGRAIHVVPAGTRVVTCPYTISLSYLNAVGASDSFTLHLSTPFPDSFLNEVGKHAPSVVGNFFLVQQYLLDARSFWHPYIKHLPQPDQPDRLQTPTWWPEEDLKYLAGTNLEPAVKEQEALWKQQWIDAINILSLDNNFPWQKYTYELYKWAASIFGSRSFRASLTIPEELINNPRPIYSQTIRDHIRKDDFSVLFPLLDIGNHDGFKKVEWLEHLTQGCFELRTTVAMKQNSQIYNFYGDKTNSELLMAYGFMLPSPGPVERDSVNLMVKFSETHLNLWRSLNCYVPDNSPTRVVGKRIFTVQKIFDRPDYVMMPGEPSLPRRDSRLAEFHPFSNGLVDIVTIISANVQESQYLQENPTICPECEHDPFAGCLARVTVQALSILRDQLERERKRIQNAGTDLSDPQNENQRLAMNFRTRQMAVLEAALTPITLRLRCLLTRSSFWGTNTLHPYISEGRGNDDPFKDMYSHLEALSLECAYGWLKTHYQSISECVEKLIAKDQEEPLPLDWAHIVNEKWEPVYFTVWIFILLAIWGRDPTFARDHLMLATWLHEMNQIYIPIKEEHNYGFFGDTQESQTVDRMIEELYKCPDIKVREDRPWLRTRQPTGMPKTKIITLIRDFASFIASEETVRAQYRMQSGPQLGQEISQKVLILVKKKANAPVESARLGHLPDPIWPGWSTVLQAYRTRRSIRNLSKEEKEGKERSYMEGQGIDLDRLNRPDIGVFDRWTA
ncbi:hypothetical protein B7463_g1906, partial [Scytalidium lignicola]